MIDYTLPRVSLAAGARVYDAAREELGDADLADLWLQTIMAVTDLTDSRARYLDRGPAALALRASVSIPGVFPPIALDGHTIVDAGVTDNLPVGELRRRYPSSTLLASDVAPRSGPEAREDWGTSVSGWSVLRDRLLPGRRPPRIPPLSMILLSSTILSGTRDRDRAIRDGVIDLYVHLGISGFGLLDFAHLRDIAKVGYEAAKPAIETWLEEHGEPW